MNKRACILFILFLISSLKLAAQSNSLPPPLKMDSNEVVTLSADSTLRNVLPPSGFCCMLPPKYDIHLLRCALLSSFASFTVVIPNDANFAKADIKNGKPRIFFPLELTGTSHFNSKADKEFQKKYGVAFFRKDSVRSEGDDKVAYNGVIFAFLDQKFGNQWRFDLRADAIGFEAQEKNLLQQAIETIQQGASFAMQIASPEKFSENSMNQETETTVWWYILPTSGFALLLSLYFIKKIKKD